MVRSSGGYDVYLQLFLFLYFEDTTNQVIRNRIKIVKYRNLQLGLGTTVENVSKLGSKHHLTLDLWTDE